MRQWVVFSGVLGIFVLPLLGCGGDSKEPNGTGGSGGSVPTCRRDSDACANTNDCCSSLICQSNRCVAPPTCRAQGEACSATTDCCTSLVCTANKCQMPPKCGDGTCSPGETQDSCCADCGCVLGSYCSWKTKTCLAASIIMRWTFQDSCADGKAIQYRFFDFENGVGWPSAAGDTYQSVADGVTGFTDIQCIQGAQICYGAEPRPTNSTVYWGVGVDGKHTCDNCCVACGSISPEVTLTCPSAAGLA